MTYNFLYLDDENNESTGAFCELLNRANSKIKVSLDAPLPFSDQIALLKKNSKRINGLILDLRLDIVANNDKKVNYRALTLAQEIRTRITEGTFPAIPLILCSTDARLNKSYRKDETGHDLFDTKFLKQDIVSNSTDISSKLESLARGYRRIVSIKERITSRGDTLFEFFGISKDQSIKLDKRLLNYFGTTDGKLPEHEYARLLLKEMIGIPGVLINEDYLAARLGIDLAKSTDWSKIKLALRTCAYSGPFNEGWNRWWMFKINDWWRNLKNCPGDLIYFNAPERALFLGNTLKIKGLIPAKPHKKNYSTSFWTVCKALKIPIDPIDGFALDSKSPLPWQENEYICIDAALRRIGYQDGLRVHPFEEDRLKDLKNTLN